MAIAPEKKKKKEKSNKQLTWSLMLRGEDGKWELSQIIVREKIGKSGVIKKNERKKVKEKEEKEVKERR